jgi:hypothetical protein
MKILPAKKSRIRIHNTGFLRLTSKSAQYSNCVFKLLAFLSLISETVMFSEPAGHGEHLHHLRLQLY